MIKFQRVFNLWSRHGNCIWKKSRENNSESMEARVVILICDILSWPVLHNWEVSWLFSKRYSSYGAYTKLHLKQSRGNNSEGTKARVFILVRDTLSWSVLHKYEVSWLCSKGYLSYKAETKLHLKPSRGNNSIVRKQELSFLYATHRHDLFYITEISWLYSKEYSSYKADMELHKKYQRGDNSKSIKGKALIFVRDTSSWPVLHNCEVSSKYFKWFSS